MNPNHRALAHASVNKYSGSAVQSCDRLDFAYEKWASFCLGTHPHGTIHDNKGTIICAIDELSDSPLRPTNSNRASRSKVQPSAHPAHTPRDRVAFGRSEGSSGKLPFPDCVPRTSGTPLTPSITSSTESSSETTSSHISYGSGDDPSAAVESLDRDHHKYFV